MPPPSVGEIVAVAVTDCPKPDGLGVTVTEVLVLVPLRPKIHRWNADA
ncbi:MAG TPA: hypothetical protein VH108_06655 [Gaiellaceae bacterium]|nr:hypothetical protein [Gaiellaceae bacterium]